MRAATGTPLLLMEGIDKSFGENRVLRGAGFELLPGETHILAGENGAGKSTLMKILGGVHAPDAGTVRIGGAAMHLRSPQESRAAGVSMIHQEMSLVESMSVTDNLLLGESGGLWLKARQRDSRAREICGRAGLELDVRRAAGELPVSVRTQVEIAKALSRDASIVVMDEPTAALPRPDVLRLFELIAELKTKGRGVIYISHRMEEIYGIGDRITVLRDGALVGTAPAAELPESELVKWMVGRASSVEPARAKQEPVRGTGPVLEVKDLSVRGERGWILKDVSFELHPGEILGVAGLQGSGNSELLETIFGGRGAPGSGRLKIQGAPHVIQGPQHSLAQGMAYLTPDRKSTGLVLGLSVMENITLSALPRYTRGGWVSRQSQRQAALDRMSSLRVRASSEGQAVGELSGGNQQKVALAKCLETRPRILLLDEPTRGVDVGAKQEIHALIRQWTARGMAIVLISSELPELLALSDRVLVMHRGQVTASLVGKQATPEAVLRAALGQLEEKAQ